MPFQSMPPCCAYMHTHFACYVRNCKFGTARRLHTEEKCIPKRKFMTRRLGSIGKFMTRRLGSIGCSEQTAPSLITSLGQLLRVTAGNLWRAHLVLPNKFRRENTRLWNIDVLRSGRFWLWTVEMWKMTVFWAGEVLVVAHSGTQWHTVHCN